MYLYYLPLQSDDPTFSVPCLRVFPCQIHLAAAQNPTPDGGLEHTGATFHAPIDWLSLASRGEIILYLPQFFLLTLISPFLPPPLETSGPNSKFPDTILRGQREALMAFVESSEPPWGDKCISPLAFFRDEKRELLALDNPGPELQGTNRKGDSERIVLVNMEEGDQRTPALEIKLRENFLKEIDKERL